MNCKTLVFFLMHGLSYLLNMEQNFVKIESKNKIMY